MSKNIHEHPLSILLQPPMHNPDESVSIKKASSWFFVGFNVLGYDPESTYYIEAYWTNHFLIVYGDFVWYIRNLQLLKRASRSLAI